MKNRTASLQITAFAFLALSVIIFANPLLASGASTAFDSPSSYGTNWEHERRAEIAVFNKWATDYLQQGSRRSLAEGLYLAQRRGLALSDLIKNDPAEAIASTVPVAIRKQLPAEISQLLETPVSGLGNYSVLGALRFRDGPAVEPVRRFVQLGDKTYRAYVYGRRLGETTKNGIPLHGIVLDGAIALHESALRALESDEAPDPAKPITDLSASPARPAEPLVLIFAEVGNRIYRFASPKHFLQAEAQVERAESAIGPQPEPSVGRVLDEFGRLGSDAELMSPTPGSAWTQGHKNVLIIRVDFSDMPGTPRYRYGSPSYTAVYAQDIANAQIGPFFTQSSYGLTSLTSTVTTQLYRMPSTASHYAMENLNTQLHNDARAAAAANYALANYQRVVVLFSYLGDIQGSQINYRGLGEIGGPNAWMNGSFDLGSVAHELGHTYGLFHANLWVAPNQNPIGSGGHSEEYGDQFDIMGSIGDARHDFNPWFKNRLNWIANSKIKTVTASGIYRVNRFDNSTGTGTLALKVVRNGTQNYWISCRRRFTDNSSMRHGAYIIWGYNAAQPSNLLDMTTPGDTAQDAALAIGATFIDHAAHLLIRPVAEGGVSPNEYLDVQVNMLPSNDFFAEAQILSGRKGSAAADSRSATKQPGEPNHAGNSGGKSVWYRWNPPADGVARFNTFGSNFDTLLAVYRDGLIVVSNDDASSSTLQSAVTFYATKSTYYYIAVDGHNGAGGNISLNWSLPRPKADFNLDGRPDILWQNNVTGGRLIWYMQGTIRGGSVPLQTMSTEWNIAGSGNFDGNDIPDILWQNSSTGQRMVGNVSLPTISTEWNIAGSGDFNGDDKADILWQNSSTGQRAVWLMNGTVYTGSVSLATVSTEWKIAGAGDFNLDGKADILWQNSSTGERLIWLMIGTVHTSNVHLETVPIEWDIRNH